MGYAATLAVVLFALIAGVTALLWRSQTRSASLAAS